MTSVPAWGRDDRPGVKVFSKICPDCEVMDAEQNDPRKGLRHASEFGLHYRAEDGLQAYCRHHMRQRRRHERATPAADDAGRLSAAGMRALQPPHPLSVETPSNGHEPPAEEALTALRARLDVLEKSVQVLQDARPQMARLHDLGAMQARLTTLEEAATAPLPDDAQDMIGRLKGTHEALASRVAALERAMKEEEEGPAGAASRAPANTRSLRRWTKQLSKEVANLSTRVERAEEKTSEAVRTAQAAGRINAGRTAETAPRPSTEGLPATTLAALRSELWAEMDTRVAAAVDTHLQAPSRPPHDKEDIMMQIANHLSDGPAPGPPGDNSPDAVRATVLSVLARYTMGLRNVAQIERDGLLEATDITMIAERIQQRSADELCAYIVNLSTQTSR